MSGCCSWAWCDRPRTTTYWCTEHGDRIAHATTTLDAEAVSDQ